MVFGNRRTGPLRSSRQRSGDGEYVEIIDGAVGGLVVTEAVLVGLWCPAAALACSLVQPPTIRASTSARERFFARLPTWIRPIGAAVPQLSLLPGRAWQRFERRWWGSARTADAASDRVFALPALLTALLLVVAVVFLVVSVSMGAELVPVYWALPTLLLLLNFSVFASTVAMQQRVRLKRTPFEWQLTLLVGMRARLIRRARRDGTPAEVVEERVMTATRRIERLLRNRYPATSTSASERAAENAWALRLQPLLDFRARRLLAPDSLPPAVWFAEWVDAIAEALQRPTPLPAVDGATETRPSDPMPRIPVVGLWVITVGIAAVGVLTSPPAVEAFTHADWKVVGSVVAVVVGLATCNYGIGWYRRSGGSAS